MRQLTAALALAAAAVGCGSPQHENPFDPSTPTSEQARATLAGSVSLEPLGSAAPDLSGVRISIPGAGVVDTDGAGRWSLPNVPIGVYTVHASKTGWVTGSVTGVVITLDDGDSTVTVPDLALAVARGSLGGQVTLLGAGSSAGIVVNASGPISATAVTDATGGFLFAGLPIGDYSVVAQKDPEWSPSAPLGVTVAAGAVTSLPVDVVLQPRATASISGAAPLEGGGDASGTNVALSGVDFRGAAVSATTSTSAAGAWSFGLLAAGSYQVTLSRPTFVSPAPTSVSLSTGQAVDVGSTVLAFARGSASGTAVASGAADLSGTVVTVSGGPDSATAVTDSAGAFTVSGLRVGTGYAATFRRGAYATQTSAPFAISAGATTAVPAATLSLLLTASISGQADVERPAGASGGIAVSLTGADLNGAAVTASTFTQPTGSYALPGLPQGTYAVTFSKSGYDPRSLSGIFVAAGASVAPAGVVLPVATGTVAGTATLSAGAVAGFQVGTDFSGVVVTLSGVDVPVAAAVTDPAGAYRFTGVPVSTSGAAYTVTAQKPSFQTASTTVLAAANTTVGAAALSLPVNAGGLSGSVLLRDDVGGAGDNATHAGTSVGVTGTAFNGTSWSAGATTASDGTFLVSSLPPGSYDLVATSASRTCAAFAAATVQPGATSAAGTVRCLDALAPTAVALGAPLAPPGGQSGYAAGTSVTVPISTPATDPTTPASNFRGYQVVVGTSANWAAATTVAGQPGSLTFAGLAANSPNTLWARAVDWIGNAGPVSTLQVITDTLPPPAPTVSTPRPFVNATTTSVTLSGAEGDATFAGYEICTLSQAATVGCAVSAPLGCAFSPTAAAFALSLTAGQRTCLWARAFDRAGNRGPTASLGVGGVVSDLTPPSPPTLAPSYDPTLLAVRAPWVDLFVTGAATDGPAGGAPWQDVAWLEVDTGSGFEPLCPAPECRPGDVWSPCACGCTDPRLLCDGTRFVGFRARLLEGTRNLIAARAVDLAGNVGSGVSQQVETDSTGDVIAATSAFETNANVRGKLVGYGSFSAGGSTLGMLVDLGSNRRHEATDRRCQVSPSIASGYGRGVVPVSATLVATAEWGSGARMIRPGADGLFCTGDDVATVFRTPPIDYLVDGVSGAGERVAWMERKNPPGAVTNIMVREPGLDGVFGNGDDVTTAFPYQFVDGLTMGDAALLVHAAACGDSCFTYTWHVINPNAAASYASGTTTLDLPGTVGSAALSADGRRLAYMESGFIRVLEPGANGIFDASDVPVSVAVPPEWSLFSSSELVVDGPHVVALANTSPIRWLVHWWAGPDGTFGTPDDTLERVQPTSATQTDPSLAAGYLTLSRDGDVMGLDLSALRWEVAPASGLDASHPIDADGQGDLFYLPQGGNLVARSPSGSETNAPVGIQFAVSGKVLLDSDFSNAVRMRTTDAAGTWFTPSAPAAVQLYQANTVQRLHVGGGKGLVQDYAFDPVRGTNVTHYRVLEPGAGKTLADMTGLMPAVDILGDGVNFNWSFVGALTARQVFYVCHAWGTATLYLCVHNAGADGVFGTADDPRPATFASAVHLRHPAGSPRAGLDVSDARALAVNGRRMLVSEFSPPAVYLFDAGPDGLFNTTDDRGRKLADFAASDFDIAVAGDWAAFLYDGPPSGRQAWMVRGFDGDPICVTDHYSGKTSPMLDPGGRLSWVDSVFVPSAVFSRTP
jgi:Carboxypeptidase regulatory-like domain